MCSLHVFMTNMYAIRFCYPVHKLYVFVNNMVFIFLCWQFCLEVFAHVQIFVELWTSGLRSTYYTIHMLWISGLCCTYGSIHMTVKRKLSGVWSAA